MDEKRLFDEVKSQAGPSSIGKKAAHPAHEHDEERHSEKGAGERWMGNSRAPHELGGCERERRVGHRSDEKYDAGKA
jgi:hypothetical protein